MFVILPPPLPTVFFFLIMKKKSSHLYGSLDKPWEGINKCRQNLPEVENNGRVVRVEAHPTDTSWRGHCN